MTSNMPFKYRRKKSKKQVLSQEQIHVYRDNIALIVKKEEEKYFVILKIDANNTEDGRHKQLRERHYMPIATAHQVIYSLLDPLKHFCEEQQYNDISISESLIVNPKNDRQAAAIFYLKGEDNRNLATKLQQQGKLDYIVASYTPART